MPGIERYRRLGLCISCGKQRAPGKVRCEPCLAKFRERNKVWQAQKNAAGLCLHCGVKPRTKGSYCDEHHEQARLARGSLRDEVFRAYGGYVCVCCGETRREFLTPDHVVPAGHARAKKQGDYSTSGQNWYRRLRRQGFPPGVVRILCWNCNTCRGLYGECDHERERRGEDCH